MACFVKKWTIRGFVVCRRISVPETTPPLGALIIMRTQCQPCSLYSIARAGLIHVAITERGASAPFICHSDVCRCRAGSVLAQSVVQLPSSSATAMSTKGSSAKDAQKASDIIERLKQAATPSKGIFQVLTEEEVQWLIDRASALFLRESSLLECDPPVTICGDTHGQFSDVLRIFAAYGWPGSSPEARYLFLGDYVDRGKQSIEVMCLMFALKIQHPKDVFLLRGNHESLPINRAYGFWNEVKSRYSDEMWRMFNRAFDCMAVAGLVGKRILCMHGGLSPELESLDQIRRIKRPSEAPDSGLIADLLWSDPDPSVQGFQKSHRGVAFLFGADAVQETCAKLDIDLVARAHQVVHEGYEFFADSQLVTIFSAPDYCGQFGNAAGFLFVDKDMKCKMKQLKPL